MNASSQILSWIFFHDCWWNIICGQIRDVDDAERREILQELIDNRLYDLALVLLTTHGYLPSVHHAVTKSIDKLADEQSVKAFLTDVAENMSAKDSHHSA